MGCFSHGDTHGRGVEVHALLIHFTAAVVVYQCRFRSSAFANYMDKDALEEEAVLEAMWQASDDEQ